MAPNKKTASHSPNEILAAQREYAKKVHKSIRRSNKGGYKSIIFAFPPQAAVDLIGPSQAEAMSKLHFLFLFAINSDEDKLIWGLYSDAYKSVRDEFAGIEQACKGTKVDFLDICNLIMEKTPRFIFDDRNKGRGGRYHFEKELSDLAISLRSKYEMEMPNEYHITVIKEHFSRFGVQF
jgi:hypothetical protein